MMDPEMARLIRQETPDLNPDIANGFATKHMKDVVAYTDSVFQALSRGRGFPEGLEYLRPEISDPQQAFDVITKKRKAGKRFYDISDSTISVVFFLFKYKGEEIRRPMYMPYLDHHGILSLSGTRYTIAPVLSDRVRSIDENGIFIKFGRGKTPFSKISTHYRANNHQETVDVVYGRLYNRTDDVGMAGEAVRAPTTIVHYLFCKYGVAETFKRFAGVEPILMARDQVNPELYPTSDWVICEASTLKPAGVRDKLWRPTDVVLILPKAQYTNLTKAYIAGLFYLLDLFPRRLDTSYMTDERFKHNTGRWRVLLGYLLHGTDKTDGQLHETISDHIGSLDEYVDAIMKGRFKEIGIYVDTIYEFFGLLLEKFDEWYITGANRINVLYDKELSVLDYVLEQIRISINTFYFKLVALVNNKKSTGKELRKEDIIKLMDRFLSVGKAYKMTKMANVVTPLSTSGDNKVFKTTTTMVPQSKTSRQGSRRESRGAMDRSKFLHVSTADVAGAFTMSKSDPSAHSRINPYAVVDEKGLVRQNPDLAHILEPTQEKIQRLI